MSGAVAMPSATSVPPTERTLRVAMVIQAYPPVLGGAQRQVQRLGPLLAERGVDVTVITRGPAGAPAREREPGLDVRRVSTGWDGPRASLAYTLRAAAALRRLQPDVVHVHDLMSPATAALAGAGRAPVIAKVASTGPGGDVDRLLAKPLGRRRLALYARRFAAFACLTAEVEAELRAHGVPADRLRRLVNGVETGRFRPPGPGEREAVRRELGVGEGVPLVFYAGRFAAVKRLDVLLEAVAIASPHAHLLLAGEGPEIARLRDLARGLGLGGRLHVQPASERPERLYRAADVYASASLSEGMSNALLEAMASGLPAAASPASGMAELLDGGCGLRARDAGAAALAAALGPLLADRELRARAGEAARRRILEGYALDAVADRLVATYRELAAPRTSSSGPYSVH